MTRLRIFWARLAGMLRRRAAERELEEELAFHQAMLESEHQAAGLSAEAARQAARRDLGSIAAMQETWRDRLRPRWIEAAIQNLRYAARQMRRGHLFTALAVASLAIGIGANATVFSWLDGALLRPLPVHQPGRLAAIWRRYARGGSSENFSFPALMDLSHCPAFSGVAAFYSAAALLGRGTGSRLVWDYVVAGNYFRVVRPTFVLGRGFTPAEDGAGGGRPVVVLTYRLWQRQFGGARSVLGKTVWIDQHAYTVVGVTGPRFDGTERILRTDMFLPLAMTNQLDPGLIGPRWRTAWHAPNFWNVARLQPGMSWAQAGAALAAWQKHLGPIHPGSFRDDGARLGLAPPGLITPGTRRVASEFGLVFLICAGLVLALACLNLANILLARGLARRRETAVRLAIGCGRARLVAQDLTEAVILAAIGGMAGVGLALWTDRIVKVIRAEASFPVTLNLRMDWRVLAFTAAVAFAAALVFALVPALRAAAGDPSRDLAGGAGAGSMRRSRLRGGLLGFQVALAALAVVVAGLMLRSLQDIAGAGPGFNARHVLVATFDLGEQGYTTERGRRFYSQLLAHARRLPGVEAAALTSYLPLGDSNEMGTGVRVPGRKNAISATLDPVSPDFFRTIEVPMLRGRSFGARDRKGAAGVAVINEALARRAFGSASAVGRTVRIGSGRSYRIVGVAANFDVGSLGETTPHFFAVPFAQRYAPHMNLLLRIGGPPVAMAPRVRKLVAGLDPKLVITSIAPLSRTLDFALLPARLAAVTLALFGGLALLLAAIGAYGVITHAVVQRTAEIGTRVALGARRRDILALVLRRTVLPAAVGLCAGLALALAVTRVLGAFLYGIGPRDPVAFLGGTAALAAAITAAAWIPAGRAMRLDPARALRHE